jgi:iron complex transport system substrate-binding protein
MKKLFTAIALLGVITACNPKKEVQKAPEESVSIVSIGGAITETLFALGVGESVKAIDITSTYPERTQSIAQLGHLSAISIENVLSFNPTLILATQDQNSGIDLFSQLKESNAPLQTINAPLSVEDAKVLISNVGEAINKKEEAAILVAGIDSDLTQLSEFLSHQLQSPKVLFIYSRGSNMLMVGGKNTGADVMIKLAGGINVAESIDGFKPLSPEALIQYNPDVILLFDSGLESLNGLDGVLKMPGVMETNAGKNNKIVAMDGHYLMGFGPRVGKAAIELAQKIRE